MHRPHPLLDHAIDYAALFPPATRSMAEAVGGYTGHTQSDDAWALGRFVVPASRLDELLRALDRERGGPPVWPLAVTGGGNVGRDLAAIADAEGRAGGRIRVEAFETRAHTVDRIATLLGFLPSRFTRFLEIPLEPDPAPLAQALGRGGAAAKFRTGGVTADAFPDPEALLRGLEAVVGAGVPFKCTAGLHHPVRGRYRLTYASDSGLTAMFGYLNVLVAALALRAGWPPGDARAILLEENPTAFALGTDGVAWQGRPLPLDAVVAMRRDAMQGFGSCSFEEPMDELAEIPVA